MREAELGEILVGIRQVGSRHAEKQEDNNSTEDSFEVSRRSILKSPERITSLFWKWGWCKKSWSLERKDLTGEEGGRYTTQKKLLFFQD